LHLTLESIIDLLEGRSDDKHADQCPECRGRVEEWRLLHSRLHRSHLTDAPSAALKAAYGIPGPRPGIGQAVASLIFDSFSQPAFAGARGASEARQVVLRTAEIDIHVRISGKPESRQISGQILTRSDSAIPETVRVHLVQNDARIRSADLNPLGEFEFGHAPDGMLSLQVDLPNRTVYGPLGNEEVA
jgi:hypothetical protein